MEKNLKQKFWAQIETYYRESFQSGIPRLEFLAKQINRFIRKGKILDIGIGNGFLLEKIYLSNPQLEIYGIDISPENISITTQQFKKKKIKANLTVASIENLPYQNEFFDLIVASEVLEHLEDEALIKGLKEVYRVLKKNGKFLVTTPFQENLKNRLCFCPKCGYVFHRWGHRQSFTQVRLEKIFRLANLTIKKIKILTWQFDFLKPKKGLKNYLKYCFKIPIIKIAKKFLARDYYFYLEITKL